MIQRANENLIATAYSREGNSVANYSEVPLCKFKCRVAESYEENSYQPIAGVFLNENHLTLYASRLEEKIKVGDKVVVLGQEHIVESIGYFISQSNQLHAYDLKPEELFKRSPKGIVLR